MIWRLIYLDVDGTLLTPDRRISPATGDALRRAAERGCRIGLATGRMFASALPYARAVEARAPLILYNGGRIERHEPRETWARTELPLPLAQRALTLLGDFDIHCNLYVGDHLYVEALTPRILRSMEQDGVEAEAVGDLIGFLRTDPVKLLLIGEGEELERFRTAYLDGLEDPPHLVRSEPTYLEILPKSVNKGAALGIVCRRMGVPPEEVVAFGDSWNDVEMLEAAGLGVAMGNSPTGVQQRADVVTGPNHEDGVAEALERYVLS